MYSQHIIALIISLGQNMGVQNVILLTGLYFVHIILCVVLSYIHGFLPARGLKTDYIINMALLWYRIVYILMYWSRNIFVNYSRHPVARVAESFVLNKIWYVLGFTHLPRWLVKNWRFWTAFILIKGITKILSHCLIIIKFHFREYQV